MTYDIEFSEGWRQGLISITNRGRFWKSQQPHSNPENTMLRTPNISPL